MESGTDHLTKHSLSCSFRYDTALWPTFPSLPPPGTFSAYLRSASALGALCVSVESGARISRAYLARTPMRSSSTSRIAHMLYLTHTPHYTSYFITHHTPLPAFSAEISTDPAPHRLSSPLHHLLSLNTLHGRLKLRVWIGWAVVWVFGNMRIG